MDSLPHCPRVGTSPVQSATPESGDENPVIGDAPAIGTSSAVPVFRSHDRVLLDSVRVV